VLPFLAPLWAHPAVAAFITGQLPSLLLIADMALLPHVLRLIARWVVGLASEGEVTRWVVGWFYFFLILNVFLVSALSGASFALLSVTHIHARSHQTPTNGLCRTLLAHNVILPPPPQT
jgi:hypothetical protein